MKQSQSLIPVLIEHNKNITWLRLNNTSQLNALNPEMINILTNGIKEALSRETKLIVFSGEGIAFSSGFDLSKLDQESDADLLYRFVKIEELLQSIYKLPISSVALVHGKCFGAGADIVASCQHRIASHETTFRMPGLQFGIVLGTRRLSLLVGKENAINFLETSRIFNADEALKSGFLTNINSSTEWPKIIEEISEKASNLSLSSKNKLMNETRNDTELNNDLAALVKSAAEPGLVKRIQDFVNTQVKK
ncbi:enoyl-CoA hydratase/isomerase family protein [Alphaproteobacteria bacterium]|nr:enoyl-CoA hydratase/isomerase family protein [Alphaproteobacteria bacterium]